MICKNCNTPYEDGSEFCAVCGARLDEEMTPESADKLESVQREDAIDINEEKNIPIESDAVSASEQAEDGEAVFFPENDGTDSDENANGDIKKKKISKKAIVITAVIVVLMGALLAFASFSDLFKSDAEVYRNIELESLRDGVSILSDALDDAFDINEVSASVKLKASDELIGMLGEGAAVLGDVRSAGVDIDYAREDNLLGGKMDINIGDTELFGYELVFDTESEDVYISFPGLNDKAIKLGISELMGESGISASEFADNLNAVMEFLDNAEIKPIVTDIISAAVGEVKDVNKSKGTLTAGGVSQECTVYTVAVDDVLVENMAKAVLREIKDNKNVKNIVFDFMNMLTTMNTGTPTYSESELSEMIDEGIDSAIESIDLVGSGIDFEYRLYADGHDVIGREILYMGQSLKYAKTQSGSDYAFELSFGDESYKEICILAEGTMKAGRFTGDAVLEYRGSSIIEVEYTDFVSDIDDMSSKGKMSIGLGDAFYENFDDMGMDSSAILALKSAKLEFTLDNTNKKIDTNLALKIGGVSLLEIEIKGIDESDYSLKIPENIYAGDMDSYMSDVDPYVIIERLKKAGFPDELFGFGDASLGY